MIRHLIITAPCSSKMHICVTFGDNRKGMEQNFLSSDQNFCFVSSTLYLSYMTILHPHRWWSGWSELFAADVATELFAPHIRSLPSHVTSAVAQYHHQNCHQILLCITANNINIMTISFLLGPPPLWCSCHKNLITNKWFCWTKYRLSLPKIDIYCKYGWSDAKNWC